MSRVQKQMERALKDAISEGEFEEAAKIARDYCQLKAYFMRTLDAVFQIAKVVLSAFEDHPAGAPPTDDPNDRLRLNFYSEYDDEGGYKWHLDMGFRHLDRYEVGIEHDLDCEALKDAIDDTFELTIQRRNAAGLKEVVLEILHEIGIDPEIVDCIERVAPAAVAPAPVVPASEVAWGTAEVRLGAQGAWTTESLINEIRTNMAPLQTNRIQPEPILRRLDPYEALRINPAEALRINPADLRPVTRQEPVAEAQEAPRTAPPPPRAPGLFHVGEFPPFYRNLGTRPAPMIQTIIVDDLANDAPADNNPAGDGQN